MKVEGLRFAFACTTALVQSQAAPGVRRLPTHGSETQAPSIGFEGTPDHLRRVKELSDRQGQHRLSPSGLGKHPCNADQCQGRAARTDSINADASPDPGASSTRSRDFKRPLAAQSLPPRSAVPKRSVGFSMQRSRDGSAGRRLLRVVRQREMASELAKVATCATASPTARTLCQTNPCSCHKHTSSC